MTAFRAAALVAATFALAASCTAAETAPVALPVDPPSNQSTVCPHWGTDVGMWGPHGSLTGGYFELGIPAIHFESPTLIGYVSVEYNDQGECCPLQVDALTLDLPPTVPSMRTLCDLLDDTREDVPNPAALAGLLAT